MKLHDLRIKSGKDQKEIAEILGVVVSTYSQYETEKRIPSVSVLTTLADYYGVSVDYILGRVEEEAQPNLSASQKEILFIYDEISEISKQALLKEARYLLGSEQYQNRAFTTGHIAAKGGETETREEKPPWEDGENKL